MTTQRVLLPGVWQGVEILDEREWDRYVADFGQPVSRLWRDGHGIDRLALDVSIGGTSADVCVVRSDDLLALEQLVSDCADVLSLVDATGIDWDDAAARSSLFDRAGALFLRLCGVIRDDEPCFEDDDETRPI